jgi:cysteine desulfurase family protein (TIGR01976 family)
MIDVEQLRSRFPALTRTTDDGSPVVHLDGPAGTQMPQSVADAVSTGLIDAASNLGGPFEASHRSEAVVRSARDAAADLLGGRPEEVVFGPNMTSLTFAFSRAIARSWGPGDTVVVSGLDHDANVTPWVMAATDRGADVLFADIRHDDVTLDLDHLESLLDGTVKLVAITGCSNAFGSLVDVGRVAQAAHEVGALCFVDAVHLAPHRRIDVQALGVDALVCSAYKFYGPHVGILWGRPELLAETVPYKVRPAPSDPPGKFETGTPSFGLLNGVTAAVDHIAALGDGPNRRAKLDDAYERVGAHERALGERFLAGLPEGVRVWGRSTMDGRVSTFAIEVEGRSASDVATRLGDQGIATWPGHYYAVEPMRRLGWLDRGGLVRIGFVATTTEAEVDRLLSALSLFGTS